VEGRRPSLHGRLMTSSENAPARRGYLELVVRRLRSGGSMTSPDEALVRGLSAPRRLVERAGQILSKQDKGVHFVLDGWGCQMRPLAGGRRVLFAFILPGDVIGLIPDDGDEDRLLDSVALTQMTIVDATSLLDRVDIAQAVAGLRVRNRTRLFDQIMRLGRHNAYDRVAHLLLELYTRQAEIGMVDGPRFLFPLGQDRLGEMLGLSEVHIHRTLSKLRADGHLAAGAGWMALSKWRALALQVGFEASDAWPR
jgi:CRP-like cAMP-binding protein